MLSLCSSFHQEKVQKNLLNIALRVEEIFLFTVGENLLFWDVEEN